MGYAGKTTEREQSRELRRLAWTLDEIAVELGVAKSSVSLWVRDVEFLPRPRSQARLRGPNALQRRKAQEIADLRAAGSERLGCLSDQAFLAAGAARIRPCVRRSIRTDAPMSGTTVPGRIGPSWG